MKKKRSKMQNVARYLEREFPGCGFILMATPFGDHERLHYVSNINRDDVTKVLKEFLVKQTSDKFGTHDI
jgi:hypothetical protein